MKYEEALHEISTMVYRNTDDFSMRISKDCYKSVIKALEKQIPKKIRGNDDGWLCCPNCDKTFHLHNSFGKKNRHCGNCGQAVIK